MDGEVSLESPTKTMALVMGFMENNNKLLAQVKDLENQIQQQANTKEVGHQLDATTREELKKVCMYVGVCYSQQLFQKHTKKLNEYIYYMYVCMYVCIAQ